ncbi:MAG: primosomal protein N' [Proteobacteria bacterium]|nr:primosomal protein N' [Pseudomonadota bacterium]
MIVDVAIPVRVANSFHYLIDESSARDLSMGSVVSVPFGSRTTYGFVVGFPEKAEVESSKLKNVLDVLVANPVFDEQMFKFLKWVSDYYCHPLGEVIATAIPKAFWTPRKKIAKEIKRSPEARAQNPLQIEYELNPFQKSAVESILELSETRPYLLHGVTGSGKTEVYLNVLESMIQKDKTGIILVPEIALTPQLTQRFSSRFPNQIAVLHSDLTPKERIQQWDLITSGTAKIVIGARSAVFAPLKNIGVIVVDEEHETSFKQEDSLRYNARDLAVVRAKLLGAKVILGSATPSVETYQNAISARYVHLKLPERVNKRAMPKTQFVDIKDKHQWYSQDISWLSRTLVDSLSKTLQQGQQAMLYLNRLGFAHFLFCSDCGHTWRCRNCDVSLTYYQNPPILKCHYCGEQKKVPHSCEVCQGIRLDTMGLGTEQVEKTLQSIFPKARICRMDRGVIKNKKDLERILNRIHEREVDFIIGTQMIAKGHDFPGIALVGVLLADASLNLPDFRANERTFQVVTQVSGRAGRADTPGEVIIQALNPGHPVLLAASHQDQEEFYRTELATRKLFQFPPFHRAVMLRFQHTNPQRVETFANQVVRIIQSELNRRFPKCQILGPTEAPISKVKKMYRWQCLVKTESVKEIQTLLKMLFDWEKLQKSNVKMAVDVDPINLL